MTKLKIAIAKGNTKMGDNMPSISLPPGTTCSEIACKTCLKSCYIMKAWRMYKATRAAYKRNLKIWKTAPEEYMQQVREYLKKKKPRFFRWHVGGDIPDQYYLDWMLSIAANFHKTKFLVFTKKYELDYSKSRFVKNLAVVFSAWPGVSIDRMKGVPIAWMQDGTETRVPEGALECHGGCSTCGMCWNLPKLGKDVFFNKH